MYRQFANIDYRNRSAAVEHDNLTIAQSGQLDALVALEQMGTRLSFTRNAEIYAKATARTAGTKSFLGRSGSASFSPMAAVI